MKRPPRDARPSDLAAAWRLAKWSRMGLVLDESNERLGLRIIDCELACGEHSDRVACALLILAESRSIVVRFATNGGPFVITPQTTTKDVNAHFWRRS